MIIRNITAAGMLCAASLLVAAPMAHADSGSSSLSGPYSLSGQINVGCIVAQLETLSGAPSPGAGCIPATIPTNRADDGVGELALP
ncbi:hypothetical protein ACFYTQ_23850 [Nocardia sp. NPDC004068]|uniref:hypothetical protein n=1 Tax=Nocardia sp. NPDC004068 TaxID=3364303 RepID=UPI0036775E30